MFCLYVQAEFASFRTFSAGSFRPTSRFMTYSAAYGLLLNLAGIESRYDDGKSPMTLTRSSLPRVKIALGAKKLPKIQSIYQQLHNYPVGADAGKKYKEGARGTKYNITPVRREFLMHFAGYICIDNNPELQDKIKRGLLGDTESRYGLPFLGDNNFLPDRIEIVDKLPKAHWFLKLDKTSEPVSESTRLTISIDRSQFAETRSALFAPSKPSDSIPEDAWIEVGS